MTITITITVTVTITITVTITEHYCNIYYSFCLNLYDYYYAQSAY